MGWIVTAQSSLAVVAERAETQHWPKNPMRLRGVFWHLEGGGSTAAAITLRYGDSSDGTLSSLTLAASTGGSNYLDLSDVGMRAYYFAIAATTHIGTSNTVGIWGD